ncbi:MAG: hypothetical protein ACI4JB_09685 [Porcipelethomonas sp.]
MKKFGTAMAVMLICAGLMTGCGDDGDITTASIRDDSSAASEELDKAEEETSSSSQENEQENISESSKDDESPESSAGADSTAGESTESQGSGQGEDYESGIDGMTETAQAQFEKSCRTQWEYLMDCPYELDYDDMYGNAVRVKNVNSISEVMEDYGEVFIGDRPELLEKYIETRDGLYCYDGGRGANIEYQGTDLITVKVDGDTAEFTAVSHYTDPSTGEQAPDVENSFVMVYTDGVWKTSVFTLPY